MPSSDDEHGQGERFPCTGCGDWFPYAEHPDAPWCKACAANQRDIEQAERIAKQNDEFRASLSRGKVYVTRGVEANGADFVRRALDTVRGYADWSEAVDPWGEHDFGSFELEGRKLFWKIDYYDRDLLYRSPDPANPAETVRVLTVMLAEEY